jgi:hypothetical protein
VKLGAAALATWIAVSTTSALAEPTARFTRVALLLPACELPGLAASELRSALALDLRDGQLGLAPPGELAPASDVLVSFSTPCDGSSSLALRAEYGGERYARTIDLGELPPPQRARALSLALTELLSLFRHPSEPPPGAVVEAPPAVAPPAPVAAPAAPPPAPPAPKKEPAQVAPTTAAPPSDRAPAREDVERPWQVALAPELRFFQASPLWGARALVRYRGLSGGASFVTTSTSVPAGAVVTRTAHALVGYAVPVWRADTTRLEAGARLGAGRTFFSASASASNRAADAQDVYLDAAAGLRGSFRLAPRWSAGLGVELGYASGPIGYADNEEVARTSGVFAGAAFDIAFWL